MLDDTGLIAKPANDEHASWTRVKRKDTTEKSVIDYIVMSKNLAKQTTKLHIDEEGVYRLKGKKDSNHNTIVVELNIPWSEKPTKKKIYNLADQEGWDKFNKKLDDKYERTPPTNYDQLKKQIKDSMSASLKKITIRKG